MKHAMLRTLRRILPHAGYLALRRMAAKFRYWILIAASFHPGLSLVYYLSRPSVFAREAHSLLYGKRMYYEELLVSRKGRFLLRRNIHRIEKGLLMRPRRSAFATTYIGETVSVYADVLERCGEPNEVQWAHDVLDTYFSVTESETSIDAARRRFTALPSPSSCMLASRRASRAAPYFRELEAEIPSYEALLALARRRRSVRWYLARAVPRELIDQALIVAGQSPSACNRQPFAFRIFDDPDDVARISALPMGTAGFSHNFPAIAAIVGRQRAYFDERDRHVIYIDASLAAMSFMLALETLGLSSCPINWPDVAHLERRMGQELDLEPDERVVLLLSIGYPDPAGMVAYSQKRPLEELRRYG